MQVRLTRPTPLSPRGASWLEPYSADGVARESCTPLQAARISTALIVHMQTLYPAEFEERHKLSTLRSPNMWEREVGEKINSLDG